MKCFLPADAFDLNRLREPTDGTDNDDGVLDTLLQRMTRAAGFSPRGVAETVRHRKYVLIRGSGTGVEPTK